MKNKLIMLISECLRLLRICSLSSDKQAQYTLKFADILNDIEEAFKDEE